MIQNRSLGELKQFLDAAVDRFNTKSFIAEDPISIPHRFSKKQDIEISALWIALIAWGNRKSILHSGDKLMQLMDYSPYDYILNHSDQDRSRFLTFVHRTFNSEDAIYFLEFFKNYYSDHKSLEEAFSIVGETENLHAGSSLQKFRSMFIRYSNAGKRTLKHIATPEKNSRCKRLLMFLRWMVRSDDRGVDFGIWKTIKPFQLLIPLDVHVENTSRKLGMLRREQSDWKAVLELSQFCSVLDPSDPVKYDFALFGLGALQKKTSKLFRTTNNFVENPLLL